MKKYEEASRVRFVQERAKSGSLARLNDTPFARLNVGGFYEGCSHAR